MFAPKTCGEGTEFHRVRRESMHPLFPDEVPISLLTFLFTFDRVKVARRACHPQDGRILPQDFPLAPH